MELKDALSVVTGANRGLGRQLATQLVGRGAKVHAAARRPETVWVDTDMAAVPARGKADPADVAAQALAGIEQGLPEILADDASRYVRQNLATAPNAACRRPLGATICPSPTNI
ncbi:hypothetical protein [Streptomyces sp. NBC_00120]|uniref:hypothetical protein n=1 Tax=unclassified Streptomyces TaxID=2593676 RepID=UPI00225C20A0|nr:hypothetical protein [Streptomyces sp. NBC_00120]MCX5319973.1 hypothetical protein [Streptomyces sp. NBC_00120]